MSKSDQGLALEEILVAHLARVIDFLKFAEAKNAALLAFASAWIVGLTNLLSSGRTLPAGFTEAATIALGLFVLAALTAIISLLPKLGAQPDHGEEGQNSPSLLFFGHVATMTATSFISDARERYDATKNPAIATALQNDLADQIVTNSRIARRKYRTFNVGALSALAGIGTFAVPTALLLCGVFRAAG
ncbi:MAG TPA: Pycsar system effector family protein [Pyrinomonadaceae bacterium]|nr:Pycsar system effector family protein [Pyrinomonadaceae bacterium]